ncbi:hypothetical protein V5799_014846 [Amblyomma americanum]|uniref:Uncharacterized protein n=1 Tax=Amblyomma americanum TaxID=6943 RepID=A0AAQ4E1U9_AMBAM
MMSVCTSRVHLVRAESCRTFYRDWNLNDDKSRELTDCDGVVDRLKSQYGFIRLGPHVSPAAFFRVSVLERSMKTTINDIGEVLAVGDLVRFDAELNLKDDTSAKWWVTHIQPISRIRPSADRCLGESSEKPRSSEGVNDSSKDTDEDRPSAVTKGTEKRFPWSYARCAARAVAVEGVVANSSPAKKAPGTPAAAVVDRLASSVARPSLLIYRGVSGVVRSVQGGASVYCEVKEAAGTRRISLAEGCAFYKDGVRCPEDGGTIAKAVSEGDELTVDYAVSAEDLSKEADVYCHLVWQGERPKDVPNLTLELLGRALKTGPEKNPDPGAKDMLKIRES